MKVGFIGLGNIGKPLAATIMAAGHDLTVHDLDRSTADDLIAAGAHWGETPAAVAGTCDCLITALPSPQATSAVIEGDNGAATGLREGSTWIETSTNDFEDVKRLAAMLAERGVATLEATLSLGVHKIGAGEGTIFAGGEMDVFERHSPIFDAMGGRVVYMGELGKASVIKVITNLVCFVNVIGLAEGMMLAKRAGIDPAQAWQAIGASYGTSYALETAMSVILNGSFDDDFAIELACKDLRLGDEIAKTVDYHPELIARVGEIFEWAREKYGDRAYSSEAARYVEEQAGEQLRAEGFPAKLSTQGTVPKL